VSSLALLAGTPWLFFLGVTLLGLVVGSFLNVVIHRLPRMLQQEWRQECQALLDSPQTEPPAQPYNLLVPRSACPHCGHQISALENIPILSFLWLRGRCSACGAKVSWQYPLIEGGSAILAIVLAIHFGPTWKLLAALLLTWALLSLAAIDLQTHLLPDKITLPLLWGGLLVNSFGLFTSLQASVTGAMAGYLALWSVYHLFRLFTGKEGMGYGDFKLLAALGAWLGWQQLPIIIILSSIVGATVGIGLILFRGHQKNIPIPFGPYLAAAGWLALLFGPSLTQLWLGG
jgi:leader peptidase (prepilin peptidase)/N-methyltransferase